MIVYRKLLKIEDIHLDLQENGQINNALFIKVPGVQMSKDEWIKSTGCVLDKTARIVVKWLRNDMPYPESFNHVYSSLFFYKMFMAVVKSINSILPMPVFVMGFPTDTFIMHIIVCYQWGGARNGYCS